MNRKIGIVSEYYYPHLGGITEHVYYFADECLKRGYEVVLLTGYEGQLASVPKPAGLRIISLGKTLPIYAVGSFARVTLGFKLKARIRRVLDQEKFDLLHIHSPLNPVLPFLFQKYSKTVTIGTIHAYFKSFWLYGFFKRLFQRYVDKLDGVIAVSPTSVKSFSLYFTAPYRVIPNGVKTEWFAKPRGLVNEFQDGRPNILFLGRLDPRNRLKVLIAAMPKVLEKIPDARLIIVGDGPVRPVYEKQAKLLADRHIFFVGQKNEERPDYFALSHVFCYPANHASFGITLLESMAAGCPVVATNNAGFQDVITDGYNGILTKQDDPEALAKALVDVLTLPALRKRLVAHGLETAQSYSWSRVTDQVISFYDEVFIKKTGQSFTGNENSNWPQPVRAV